MKEKFEIAHSPYEIGPVGPEHAAELCEFYKGLAKPFYFSGYSETYDMRDPAAWEEILTVAQNSGDKNFALWNGNKIIGATGLGFKEVDGVNVAVFSGSQIADEYLGRGLADHLYDIRLQHLRETGFEGEVVTYIKPENTRSIKAAERSGFLNTGIAYVNHPDHNIFEYRGDKLPGVKFTPSTLDT